MYEPAAEENKNNSKNNFDSISEYESEAGEDYADYDDY